MYSSRFPHSILEFRGQIQVTGSKHLYSLSHPTGPSQAFVIGCAISSIINKTFQLVTKNAAFFDPLSQDPAKCLQAKEKGLTDTSSLRSSEELNTLNLCMDHRLRQQPGTGTWLCG